MRRSNFRQAGPRKGSAQTEQRGPDPRPGYPPPMPELEIHAARLHVRLGRGAPERAQPQDVDLDVSVRFAALPAACESDELGDTVCYAKLIEQARELCAGREFRTVEHLAYAIGR